MEFKEAMQIFNKICEGRDLCEGCVLEGNCIVLDRCDIERAEETLVKWAAEHPEKTRMDDFFEKFSKATRDEDGVPSVCARDIGCLSKCPSAPDNLVTCSDCWRRTLEEV